MVEAPRADRNLDPRTKVFWLGPISNKFLILDIVCMTFKREEALDLLGGLCKRSRQFLDQFRERILKLESKNVYKLDLSKTS